MEQLPDKVQLSKITLFLTGISVSHVNLWVLLSNGNGLYKHMFSKTCGALSNCKSSRLCMLAPLEGHQNKLRRFFSNAVRFITQRLMASALQYSLAYLPQWERIN
jgi:hypothetical protein